jgi:predicted nucleotidyltransferase
MKIQEKELKVVEEFKHLVSQKIKIHDVVVLGSRTRGESA